MEQQASLASFQIQIKRIAVREFISKKKATEYDIVIVSFQIFGKSEEF